MKFFKWLKSLHFCRGDWKYKWANHTGGGAFGFKKCYYDTSWYERTCVICGKKSIRDLEKSDYYGWHE